MLLCVCIHFGFSAFKQCEAYFTSSKCHQQLAHVAGVLRATQGQLEQPDNHTLATGCASEQTGYSTHILRISVSRNHSQMTAPLSRFLK